MKCSVLALLVFVVHGKKLKRDPSVQEGIVNALRESQKQADAVAVDQATTKMFCLAPRDAIDSDSYMNLKEHALNIAAFNVTAQCIYGGTAKVSACSAHGGNYVLSGCRSKAKSFCTAPKGAIDSDSYMNLKEDALSIAAFNVTAQCKYGGTAKVSACSAHEGNYVLSGCRSKADSFCTVPRDSIDSDSYMNIKEDALSIANFAVKAQCRYGGTAKVSACSAHGEDYVLSGCRSKAKSFCTAPRDSIDSDSYMNLKEDALSIANFAVKAQCRYGGTAKVSACSVHGGNYVLSGCSSKAIAPADAPMLATKAKETRCRAPTDSDLSVYMSIKEKDLSAATFDVKAECKYGGIAKVTACSVDMGKYVISGCRTKAMQMAGEKGLQEAKKIVEAAVHDVETDDAAAKAKKMVDAALADVEKGNAADAAAEAKAKAAKEAAQKMKASTEKSSAQHRGGFLGWLVGW